VTALFFLTDVTCAFLKINGGILLKLHGIVSFIHWIDPDINLRTAMNDRNDKHQT